MERIFYSLRIACDPNQFDSISTLLDTKPNKLNFQWVFEVEDKYNMSHSIIERFLKVLSGNYEKLKELGVEKTDISVWIVYEYEDQCNFEFNPNILRDLGENELALCISCYN